jgi:hypothetical protein
MALVGTFEAIAVWAAGVIDGVSGYNKVWNYRRKIRTNAQLAADFGTGANNADGLAIIKGWMVDVVSREIESRNGNSAQFVYTVNYICLWSLEDQGANRHDFVEHIETVADTLVAEKRPTALASLDGSSNEIAFPVEIGEIYTVQFPIDGGRLHYRADLSQVIRLRQNIRS